MNTAILNISRAVQWTAGQAIPAETGMVAGAPFGAPGKGRRLGLRCRWHRDSEGRLTATWHHVRQIVPASPTTIFNF